MFLELRDDGRGGRIRMFLRGRMLIWTSSGSSVALVMLLNVRVIPCDSFISQP